MNKAVKRIVKDLKELEKGQITNVYYEPDENDIYKGYALIKGCEGTPYAYGNYMFEFTFSEDYPFKPPVVKFKTYDGYTRFNPNLYREGKVCLSILNTWSGEKWSSCQSISTILLNLQMVLNENPLLNEPGIDRDSHENLIDSYNKILSYQNIYTSILKYLNPINLGTNFQQFHSIIVNTFLKDYDTIYDFCKSQKNEFSNPIQIYGMVGIHMNYQSLCELLQISRNELIE
jgi:ubiquitin-protein ligase